jgi:hypothetical protein
MTALLPRRVEQVRIPAVAEQHRYGSIPVPLAQLGAGGSSIAVAALHSTRASLSAEIVSLLKLLRMRAIERLQTQQWPRERSATITPRATRP